MNNLESEREMCHRMVNDLETMWCGFFTFDEMEQHQEESLKGEDVDHFQWRQRKMTDPAHVFRVMCENFEIDPQHFARVSKKAVEGAAKGHFDMWEELCHRYCEVGIPMEDMRKMDAIYEMMWLAKVNLLTQVRMFALHSGEDQSMCSAKEFRKKMGMK